MCCSTDRLTPVFLVVLVAALVGTSLLVRPAAAQQIQVPIKNLTRVDGVRSNQLRGFGIVVGLAGTGDGDLAFVNRAIANALSRLGIKITNPAEAQLENIAAVLVTATLPPFKRSGDKIDVTVSSVGSAEDLSGGVLVQTPLRGANGKVYAVAQGSITKGGNAENRHLTTVRIPRGALVERRVPFEFVGRRHGINLQLRNADFTTSARIARTINDEFGQGVAQPENPSSVAVTIPQNFRDNPVGFISRIENLRVSPARQSRVVINERTGTVIMGGDVAVRPISVSHGDINLQVQGDQGNGQGEGAQTVNLPRSTTIQQIVDSLNEVGASTDSMIAILEALAEANALNAPLEVM